MLAGAALLLRGARTIATLLIPPRINNELLLVEVNKDIKTKKLYEIAHGEGVGRRFVFMPGADRMALRRPAGALPGSPDRITSGCTLSTTR